MTDLKALLDELSNESRRYGQVIGKDAETVEWRRDIHAKAYLALDAAIAALVSERDKAVGALRDALWPEFPGETYLTPMSLIREHNRRIREALPKVTP